MSSKLFILAVLIAAAQAACTNPKVVSQTYTSGDALLSTSKVLIIEVELDCKDELTLHGLVDDQLIPVPRSIGANKYQLSWTEDYATSKLGNRVVNFYDEEGATAIRKSLRYGEETSAKPVFSVEINNKSVRQDLMVAPSFVAVVVAVLIWWLAYTAKTKLQD